MPEDRKAGDHSDKEVPGIWQENPGDAEGSLRSLRGYQKLEKVHRVYLVLTR